MDVARLCGGGRRTGGAAPPAAEGAAAVGGRPSSGRRHPDLVQGRRRLPLPPSGPRPRPGLAAPTGAPANQVMSHSEPVSARLDLLSCTERGGRGSWSWKYPQSVTLSYTETKHIFCVREVWMGGVDEILIRAWSQMRRDSICVYSWPASLVHIQTRLPLWALWARTQSYPD